MHFLTWGGYIFNFNKVISFIKPSFTTFLQSQTYIPELNISLRVNLFVIICDAPMTAKAFNITQYNGKFGCFSCLHPGESSGYFSWIYLYLTDEGEVREDQLRDEKTYLLQVEKAIQLRTVYQGFITRT